MSLDLFQIIKSSIEDSQANIMALEHIKNILDESIPPAEFDLFQTVEWSIQDSWGKEVIRGIDSISKRFYVKDVRDIPRLCSQNEIYAEETKIGWCYSIYASEFASVFWIPEHRIKVANIEELYEIDEPSFLINKRIKAANQFANKHPHFEVDDLVEWDSIYPISIYYLDKTSDDSEYDCDFQEVEIYRGTGVIEDFLWLESEDSLKLLEERFADSREDDYELKLAIPRWYTGWIYQVYINDPDCGDYSLCLPESGLTLILLNEEKITQKSYQLNFLPSKYPAIDLTVPHSLWELMLFDPKRWARHQEFKLLIENQTHG